MRKLIRNYQVAVVYSSDFGAGWYTWHNQKELIFLPELVLLIESDIYKQERSRIRRIELVSRCITENSTNYYLDDSGKLFSKFYNHSIYMGGANALKIEWILEGTLFRIDQYHGKENIEIQNDNSWFIA